MSDNVQRTLVSEVLVKMVQKRLILLAILGAFVKVNKWKLSDILGASADFVWLMALLRQLLVAMGASVAILCGALALCGRFALQLKASQRKTWRRRRFGAGDGAREWGD
jgi:hypothetical protein